MMGMPPASAGLVIKIRAALPGGGEKFLAMRGEQGLVGGDDRLAKLQRRQDHGPGQRGAADHFEDDLDGGIVDHALPVGGQEVGPGSRVWARFGGRLERRFCGNSPSRQSRADMRRAVAFPCVENAAADSAATDHADVHLIHNQDRKACREARRPTIPFCAAKRRPQIRRKDR